MPHYEFFCHNCKKIFSRILLVDYKEGKVACPHCGSKEVEQCCSVFAPITSKKFGEFRRDAPLGLHQPLEEIP